MFYHLVWVFFEAVCPCLLLQRCIACKEELVGNGALLWECGVWSEDFLLQQRNIIFCDNTYFDRWLISSVGRASDSRPESRRFKSGIGQPFWSFLLSFLSLWGRNMAPGSHGSPNLTYLTLLMKHNTFICLTNSVKNSFDGRWSI